MVLNTTNGYKGIMTSIIPQIALRATSYNLGVGRNNNWRKTKRAHASVLKGNMKTKKTERGWGGHFICADRCRFRRNTLLENGRIKIVVSTVGSFFPSSEAGIDTIGHQRYFETMAFHSDTKDKRYHDADVTKNVYFESEWSIGEKDADDKANLMHEKVVAEISLGLEKGNKYKSASY